MIVARSRNERHVKAMALMERVRTKSIISTRSEQGAAIVLRRSTRTWRLTNRVGKAKRQGLSWVRPKHQWALQVVSVWEEEMEVAVLSGASVDHRLVVCLGLYFKTRLTHKMMCSQLPTRSCEVHSKHE